MNETRKLFWAILILIPVTIFAVPIWLAGGSIDGGLAILASWVATAFASIAPAFMSIPYWPLWFGLITLGLGFGLGTAYVKGKIFWKWGSRGSNILTGSDQQTQAPLGTFDQTQLIRANPTEQKLPELEEKKA